MQCRLLWMSLSCEMPPVTLIKCYHVQTGAAPTVIASVVKQSNCACNMPWTHARACAVPHRSFAALQADLEEQRRSIRALRTPGKILQRGASSEQAHTGAWICD